MDAVKSVNLIYGCLKATLLIGDKQLTINYILGINYIILCSVFHSSAEVVGCLNIQGEETEMEI